MRRLAELLPELGQADEIVLLLARMLGVGGLLPDQLDRDKLTNRYLRTLWDQWWRDRDRLAKRILPRDVWTFHGLRPANRPERRLALAACWLSRPDFVPWLDDWVCQTETRPTPAAALLGHLTASDEYWSTHWTFRSGRFPKAQPLLGAGRLHDIAVNVILPWLYARASADDNTGLRQRVGERYFAWPKGQDNSRLRFVRQRLLGVLRISLRGRGRTAWSVAGAGRLLQPNKRPVRRLCFPRSHASAFSRKKIKKAFAKAGNFGSLGIRFFRKRV